MTNEKAINVINTWIEPMRKSFTGNEFTTEFLDAVDSIKNNAIKYRWHDVLRDNDLPDKCGCYEVFYNHYEQTAPDEVDIYPDITTANYSQFADGKHWTGDVVADEVFAWKEIEYPEDDKND